MLEMYIPPLSFVQRYELYIDQNKPWHNKKYEIKILKIKYIGRDHG